MEEMEQLRQLISGLTDTIKMMATQLEQIGTLSRDQLALQQQTIKENQALAGLLKERVAEVDAQALRLRQITEVQIKLQANRGGV